MENKELLEKLVTTLAEKSFTTERIVWIVLFILALSVFGYHIDRTEKFVNLLQNQNCSQMKAEVARFKAFL